MYKRQIPIRVNFVLLGTDKSKQKSPLNKKTYRYNWV